MTKPGKNLLVVVAVLATAIAAVAIRELKRDGAGVDGPGGAQPAVADPRAAEPLGDAATPAGTSSKLPKLVDLGAGKCIPCKMMAPILEELKQQYPTTFCVQFIDVGEDPEPGRQYGIRVIPTQIFFDAEGKELFRHEGFFSKEDILETWKKYGVDVDQKKEALL